MIHSHSSSDSHKLPSARWQNKFDCSLLRGDPLSGLGIEEFEFTQPDKWCAHLVGVIQVHYDHVSRLGFSAKVAKQKATRPGVRLRKIEAKGRV
ncbi:MAG: hypothetical protein OEW48_13890, partial [Phycisphaerae bacterium]|nr:hypothetical protein [Phycisphaerae bacterium]